MEKQQDDTLMKARSYRGVTASALRLYTSSFRKIFKSSWHFAVIYSLIVSVLGALLTTKFLPVLLQIIALPQYKWLIAQEHLRLIIAFVVLFVLGFVVLLMVFGIVAGKLKEHKDTNKIMTDKIFNLLNQINREGIDNGTWGVAEGIDDTRSYFGTIETENLRGYKLIYIYMGAEDYYCFVKPQTADRF